MKLFLAYLHDRRRGLTAIPVLGSVCALLCYLYGLPPRPLLYTALVCAVLGLFLFLLPDFVSYYRRNYPLIRQREQISSTLELPDFPGTQEGLLWREICQSLCEKLRELETQLSQKQRDMLEYYTLWVHQVKTPLSAMRLVLQASPASKERNETLSQELFQVEQYVEMALQYQRLSTMNTDLRLERREVAPIVKQAVKKLAPQFHYLQVTLDYREFHNRVITDEKWLLFVVEQILSNAVKYAPGGKVTISMDEGDVLLIEDTGVGISPEDLPRIFERGFTGCNGRIDKSATGLGLYLTKQVLDRLQNTIEIRSDLGKGTQVRLCLHREDLPLY